MAPRPSAERIRVVTDHLRTEAGKWSTESASLLTIADDISNLRFNRNEAGLFQLVVSAHSDLIDKASARCKEGVTAFTNTGVTLKKVADTYDEEDRKYADQLKELW